MGNRELEGNIGVAVDSGNKEKIGKARVEIRFANLERDVTRIAELFRQPSVIEHLSGVTPTWKTAEFDIKKYAQNRPELEIITATEDGVRELYKNYENKDSDTVLLVAEDKQSKQIVGTVTIEKRLFPGGTYAMVSRLAVDENQRKREIGKKLLKVADALIFLPREMGGFGWNGAEAGIIDVDETEHIKYMFEMEGYVERGTQEEYCVSWNNKERRFEYRDSFRFQLSSRKFWRRHNIASLQKLLPRR